MTREQEKIIHFELPSLQGVSVTHGYNISNAFPVHFHSTYSLGIIERGKRDFRYRGRKTVLKKNDIFIVQPFEPHSCTSFKKSSHSYKILSFNLEPHYYFLQFIIDRPDLLRTIREFHAVAEYEKTSSHVVRLMDEIIAQLKALSLQSPSVIFNKEISSKIRLTKQFIEDNCHRDISLKKMSRIACLSEFHFNRYFHTCYGLSPYAYYLVCKMKKTQKTILKQRSVIETTYDIGFFDQSHFTKLFKKHIGVTPGKYLRDNKEYEK